MTTDDTMQQTSGRDAGASIALAEIENAETVEDLGRCIAYVALLNVTLLTKLREATGRVLFPEQMARPFPLREVDGMLSTDAMNAVHDPDRSRADRSTALHAALTTIHATSQTLGILGSQLEGDRARGQ